MKRCRCERSHGERSCCESSRCERSHGEGVFGERRRHDDGHKAAMESAVREAAALREKPRRCQRSRGERSSGERIQGERRRSAAREAVPTQRRAELFSISWIELQRRAELFSISSNFLHLISVRIVTVEHEAALWTSWINLCT